MLEKKEYILLTKTDLRDADAIASATRVLAAINPDVLAISVIDDATMQPVHALLRRILDEKSV